MRSLLVIVFVVLALAVYADAKNKLTGVNLSGAAFGNVIPGKAGFDYFWPTEAQIDYFLNRNMSVIRFPITWERIQSSANANLSTEYAAGLVKVVSYVTGKGKYIIIDVHNYQSYYGNKIGESNVTIANFVDLYTKLFAILSPYGDKIIWGIMNEPLGSSYPIWIQACQAVINKLRALGADQLILVPGLGYTGAGSWGTSGNWYSMWNVTDPLNNLAYEIHMYLDSDQSGTKDTCVSTTVGVDRLNYITGWLRAYGRKAIMGEIGAGRNDQCYQAITQAFQYMSNNDDVWLGWTWWAGGPGWGSYMYSLTPYDSSNTAPPQWPYITPFINSVVPTKLAINSYTKAGDVRIPIYNGRLNMFSDFSWATNITKQDTSKSFSSGASYSFIPGGPASNAMQWIGGNYLDTSRYAGIELRIYTTASLSNLKFRLVDYDNVNNKWLAVSGTDSSLSPFVVGSPDANGWQKIWIPFANYDGLRHYGFMIWAGSTAQPRVYLDEVVLIHRFAKDLTPHGAFSPIDNPILESSASSIRQNSLVHLLISYVANKLL